MKFRPVVQEMSFKRFLIWSSVGPPAQWSGTISAILKEGIMGNIHVKLYEIWTSGSEGDVVLKISYLELWWPLLFSLRTPDEDRSQ